MERVGVRGPFRESQLVERPLTRNLREERANSDLSPQAGRGKLKCDSPAGGGHSLDAAASGMHISFRFAFADRPGRDPVSARDAPMFPTVA